MLNRMSCPFFAQAPLKLGSGPEAPDPNTVTPNSHAFKMLLPSKMATRAFVAPRSMPQLLPGQVGSLRMADSR